MNLITYSLDPYGNLYFHYKNINYQANIGVNDILYLEKGNYTIVGTYENNINSSYFDSPLKQKINDMIIDDQSYGYYTEDDEIIIESDLESSDSNDEPKFLFWYHDKNNVIINYKENEDILALYDVYIYDKNNNLILKSHLNDNSSIYIIKIYSDVIFFRPIGLIDKKYNINIVNNECILVQLD